MTDSGRITADRLRGIDAFSGLSDDDLEHIAGLARERDHQAGDELIHHDDWPEDLLVIEQGEVEVRRHGETLARLGAGCVVGERGVLRRALRNADVVAVTPVTVLFLHRNKVREIRRDIPELDERLQDLAAQREG